MPKVSKKNKSTKVVDKKQIAIQEYIKSYKDYSYYSENYCKILNESESKIQYFKMFPQQKELVEIMREERFVVVEKSRQTGISTTVALYVACHLLFNEERKVLIVAHKRDGAENFLKKVKEFVKSKPSFLSHIEILNESQGKISLSNKSEAVALASSSDSTRSFTATMLVLDEAAFIPNADKIVASAMPTLSTGGRCIALSTPNGQDPFFFETVKQAKAGDSVFKCIGIYWWKDHRYNKDLVWIDPKNPKEKIIPKNEKHSIKLYHKGYEPTSPWFEDTKKSLKNDAKLIAQEYNIDYLMSGSYVVSPEIIKKTERMFLLEEVVDNVYPDIFYFENYNDKCEYGMGIDVSSGVSDDFSSIIILNITDNSIAATYKAKIKPDKLSDIAHYLGKRYNYPIAVVDVQGGYGTTTIAFLEEQNYPHIYETERRGVNKNNLVRRKVNNYYSDNTKEPGFMITTGNRPLIIENFRVQVEKEELIIPCKRLLKEIKNFTYQEKNRADHKHGKHDDLIMALSILLYVVNTDMKTIKESIRNTKNLLDNIIVADNNYYPTVTKENQIKQRKEYHGDENPYLRHSWLFG